MILSNSDDPQWWPVAIVVVDDSNRIYKDLSIDLTSRCHTIEFIEFDEPMPVSIIE